MFELTLIVVGHVIAKSNNFLERQGWSWQLFIANLEVKLFVGAMKTNGRTTGGGGKKRRSKELGEMHLEELQMKQVS